MIDQEKLVRDKRIIEATRKNLMGVAGKLGQIVKYLGTPIISQSTGNATYLDDPFDVEKSEIPVMDDDFIIREGMFFDGLSRGMHLIVKYNFFDKSLTAEYKGYRVYTEVNGFLEAYVPFPEWEKLVDSLYEKLRAKLKKRVKEETSPSIQKKLKEFMKYLRNKWGI